MCRTSNLAVLNARIGGTELDVIRAGCIDVVLCEFSIVRIISGLQLGSPAVGG